jgi:tetratricopeptide (TPR) repeat protein
MVRSLLALLFLAAGVASAHFQGRSLGSMEITAKIVLEDGSPLSSSPMISLYVPGSMYSCIGQELFLDGTLRLHVPNIEVGGERVQGCNVSLMLPGYRKFTGFVKDGTLIKLQRLGTNEGSLVSIVSLSAPAGARKQYEVGEAAFSKKKWPQAEEHFQQAVSLYPAYAMAWSELGQTFQEQNKLTEAVDAFKKAQAADPLYIKPLIQLAAVASLQERWADEMQISEQILKMHPVDFPAAYFYHAEATYHLGKLEDAERLTREALKLDPGGTCPESMLLLGAIFEKQGNVHDAVVEYKGYLKFAPHGPLAQQARNSLARLKRPD